jgi:hypothetical protein
VSAKLSIASSQTRFATELREEAACLGVFEHGSRRRERTIIGERYNLSERAHTSRTRRNESSLVNFV